MKRKFTPTIRSSFVFAALALVLAGGDGLASESHLPDATGLPSLVFVVRQSSAGIIPGFGLFGRTNAEGGRLLIRDKGGRVRALLPEAHLFDVSDPAVSWDGRRIAFAATVHPDSAWRIYVVGADGQGLAPVTKTDRNLDLSPLGATIPSRYRRYDDFDPCWLPDGRIVFASTRFPQTSQEQQQPVSNLFVVRSDGKDLQRITSERNGGEEPTIDNTGRIVYSRWFFNPYRATTQGDPGWTLDRAKAAPADTVNHWQLVSIFPDGDRIEFAGGELGAHHRPAAYQPAVLKDGRIVAVDSDEGSLSGPGGVPTLVVFGKTLGEAPREIGPTSGVSVAPSVLPDGRILYSYADLDMRPQRLTTFSFGPLRRSFRLEVMRTDGSRREWVLDVPGEDVLDAVPLVKRKVPPVIGPQGGIDDPAWTLPVTRLDQVRRGDDTFRFDCLNVYLTGPVDSPFPDAPRIAKGARIRFFAALARPEAATGDTVVLVRDAKLEPSGAVHESDIPGDVPMFEQLVDENGKLMRSAHGPAHVPGSNFSRIGSGTKCVGCHEGHSALPVPKNNYEAKWFNASTSATPTVSSGTGASELIDRRAKGTVGWVADGPQGQWARLEWPLAVEARSVVLYASSNPRHALHVRECQLVFFRDGQEVGRASAGDVKAGGTRIDFPPVRLDALEVRPTRVTGGAVALAEIETIARMIE